MNTKLFLLCFASAAATALAADSPTNNFTSTRSPIPITESMRLENLLTPRLDLPVIPLGKSDFVLSGPLAYGFRRLPPVENLSRGQKFLRLPLIRLFVPKPMPWPNEGGKYFAWRNTDNSLPWELASSRPGIQKGPY
ncbi:MAG TPA: hypothetical protein VG938_08125 [Verrucomicrobiae bacterium]|jgi:hypothetical protein|nr:hypothetical protein [Verrucomicrobiae bacterium]